MFQARYYKDLLLRSIAGPTNVLARQIAENGFQTSKLQRPLRGLDKQPTDPATAGRCHHYMRDATLIQEIMFALMHDQDRAWSMSGNLLRVATGHQPLKPGIVMRRYDNQVSLQQRGELDYM